MTNEVQQRSGVPELSSQQYDYILLDGSSSMQNKWWPMLEAIDGYVGTLKTMGTKSHIHMSIFTSPAENIDLVARDGSIADWVPLLDEPVGSHFGGTPLYDAIEVMCSNLHEINPERASLVIVTDGEENNSRVCDLVRARTLLDWARAKGWSVTFIGCDFDNSQTTQALGGTKASAIGVEKSHLKAAAEELARKRHAYGITGAPVHWTESEQQQFGGYLAPPKA